jgi:truncated hemoglobin YjbI
MTVSNTSPSLIERLGGLERLKEILTDFYHRVFKDPMIGYLFHNQEINRLIQRELEWTARLFGDRTLVYQGKPLKEAHQRHPIRRGHFFRRNQILHQTLLFHQLDADLIELWMKHSEAMINAILGRAQHDPRCEQTSMDTDEPKPSLAHHALPDHALPDHYNPKVGESSDES